MPAKKAGIARSSVGDRYRVLLDIGRTLAGTLSTDELYAAMHTQSGRVLETSGFYVSLYDAARDLATIVYFADRGETQRVDIAYRGSESQVLRTGQPVLVRDRLDDRSLMRLGADSSDITRSAISAPLIHKGQLLGAISAQSYEPAAYDEEDLVLLQGIADLAAVALDNAAHVAELARRQHEAERIEEIGRALAGSLDARDVLGKVVRAVTDVLHVDGASVWLCEGPGGDVARVAASCGELALPLGLTWELSGELAHRLLRDQLSVTVEDLGASLLVPSHLREHLISGSAIGTPILVGGETAGVLTAGSRRVSHFRADDLGVLQRLASQASVALENARLHAHLQALSLTDPLTGLPNRRRLHIHLDKEVAAARRGRALVLGVFDLDDFKAVNDTHGHLAGDEILRAFAEILDEESRSMNLVARYGGDEFVAVLSDTHLDEAGPYITRVARRVATDPVMSAAGITASVGLAQFDPTSMRTADDIIAAADTAMYEMKSERQRKRRASS